MGKEIEIKKLPEFEAMVNAGNTTYTGLVEGIGYVYWTTETLYFIQNNYGRFQNISKYLSPIFKGKMQSLRPKHYIHSMSCQKMNC